MSQTYINKFGQNVAVAGQLSDNAEGVDIRSYFNTDSVDIPFGVAVKQDTAKRDGCKTLSSSGDVIIGINVWGFNHVVGASGDVEAGGLKPLAGLQLIRRGRIYVVVDPLVTSIALGDRAFVRYAVNGGNNIIGAFSNVTDSGKNTDITKLAVFTSGIFKSADQTTNIAEIECTFTVKP